MYTKFGALGMSHILDDFLFVGPPDRFNCRADLTNFLFLCARLNVPIKLGKTVPPTTCLTIYGIEVDTVSMECRLPQDKVEKIRNKLQEFQDKSKSSLKEHQSLIGLLNFACSVVVPGRAFLRRLINLTCKISNPFHSISLTGKLKQISRCGKFL